MLAHSWLRQGASHRSFLYRQTEKGCCCKFLATFPCVCVLFHPLPSYPSLQAIFYGRAVRSGRCPWADMFDEACLSFPPPSLHAFPQTHIVWFVLSLQFPSYASMLQHPSQSFHSYSYKLLLECYICFSPKEKLF